MSWANHTPIFKIHIQMQISEEQLNRLRELVEDTIEYYCDQELVSGELAWTCVEVLGTAKIAELRGELATA